MDDQKKILELARAVFNSHATCRRPPPSLDGKDPLICTCDHCGQTSITVTTINHRRACPVRMAQRIVMEVENRKQRNAARRRPPAYV